MGEPLTHLHQRQRREMFLVIAVCHGFKGAAHRNLFIISLVDNPHTLLGTQ
jgi:hypothetical protein